jgi:hypothetical protein
LGRKIVTAEKWLGSGLIAISFTPYSSLLSLQASSAWSRVLAQFRQLKQYRYQVSVVEVPHAFQAQILLAEFGSCAAVKFTSAQQGAQRDVA